MIHETPQPLNDTDFSPQMQRIFRLAAIEASAGRNERGDKIQAEHFLVAFLQDDTSDVAGLLRNCGFTVADIRAGRLEPKIAPKTT